MGINKNPASKEHHRKAVFYIKNKQSKSMALLNFADSANWKPNLQLLIAWYINYTAVCTENLVG